MKQLALALLLHLWIHLVVKSSIPINEDHLRRLERPHPRKPLQLHNPVTYDVGTDGETHESRSDEDADQCPNNPGIEKRHPDCTPGLAGLHDDFDAGPIHGT